MSEGLPISDVVNVDVTLSPTAATVRDFGSLLLLGTSDTLTPAEGPRSYSSLSGVGEDFAVDSPEYNAAQVFFAQNPTPGSLFVARWAESATQAVLMGGVLSEVEQNMQNFSAITDGSLTMQVDGDEQVLTGIDLSAATTLPQVAAAIQSEFQGDVSLTWDANYGRFVMRSGVSGAGSTIDFAQPTDTGTDLGPLIQFTQDLTTPSTPGQEAESLAEAVNRLAGGYNDWYGMALATDVEVSDDEHLSVADIIEATTPSRVYAVTVMDSRSLDPNYMQDLGARLNAGGYTRTFWQYSSSNAHAALSAVARAFTVNYTAENTVITLKFKQQPTITPETLNVTQANALNDKAGNVFVNYANDTAILQQGTMANGDFFDERHGLDWLQNYVQTNLYNLLYQTQTKIPQTDAGVTTLTTNVEASCSQAVVNGLLAPGIWRSEVSFGGLETGDALPKGYYVYAQPVAQQSSADREARRAPPIQVAAKLAGAVHYADVLINVNR